MTLSRFPKPLLAWGITLLALGVVAVAIWAVAPSYATVRAGRADAGYLESGDCRKCHETNYTSWHATFHRTMTQEAGPQSILGDFERENTITYQGVRTEMVREKDAYWMKFTGVDGKTQQHEIVRTVGSRRIQQYLTKTGDAWSRLPVAFDLVQRRWMHLNGSFFYPDGSPYTQHVAEWSELRLLPHRQGTPGLNGKQNVEDGGGRTGHRLWGVSRTSGRARATRSFPRDAVSLAVERAKRAGPISHQPSEARFGPVGDDLRPLPWPAHSRAAPTHPANDERGRPVRPGQGSARVL